MDQNQIQANVSIPVTQEQIWQEVLENTRKTKNYMKWQLYITIILVVLPLLAMVFVVPMALRSLTSIYGSVLQ
jgi:hypothetical protein